MGRDAVNEQQTSRLIDRKRLMEEYGFTGSTADRIIRHPDVRTVHLDGERKTYVVREDVERVIQESTFDNSRVRRAS